MKGLVRLLRRIAVTVVGTVILAVGVVLLVAPGPGLLVIVLALIATASGGEVASLKSSASWPSAAASSSCPSRRMIIDRRQLACDHAHGTPQGRAPRATR
jgi:hypothetical protein